MSNLQTYGLGPARRRFAEIFSQHLLQEKSPVRPNLGWTKNAFAKAMDMSPPAIGYWCSGVSMPSNSETLEKIITVLFGTFVGYDEKKERLRAAWAAADQEPSLTQRLIQSQRYLPKRDGTIGSYIGVSDHNTYLMSRIRRYCPTYKIHSFALGYISGRDLEGCVNFLAAAWLAKISRDNLIIDDLRLFMEEQISIAQCISDPEDTQLLRSLFYVAAMIISIDDQDDQEFEDRDVFCDRAIGCAEKLIGPARAITAFFLEIKAGLLINRDDLAGARPFFERVLAIDEEIFGSGDLRLLDVLIKLESLLQYMGDLTGSLSHLRRAISLVDNMTDDSIAEALKSELSFLVDCLEGEHTLTWNGAWFKLPSIPGY